jgi:K+-transporting ATPase ATPase C chain
MMQLIRPALILFVLLSAITGLLYPMLMTGLGKVVFSESTSGSLVYDKEGKPIGSELIGQSFSSPKYFWSRPSATRPQPYNATASSGSNQGPLNPTLADAVKSRVEALRAADPDNKSPVPVDLVTASASGLDPHISPEAAEYQIGRVARERKIEVDKLRRLVAQQTEGRQWGIFGEPHINVLKLNLALDALQP